MCAAPFYVHRVALSIPCPGLILPTSKYLHVLPKFLRLQQTSHNLSAARLRQFFRKRDLRRHSDPTKHKPHVVLQSPEISYLSI